MGAAIGVIAYLYLLGNWFFRRDLFWPQETGTGIVQPPPAPVERHAQKESHSLLERCLFAASWVRNAGIVLFTWFCYDAAGLRKGTRPSFFRFQDLWETWPGRVFAGSLAFAIVLVLFLQWEVRLRQHRRWENRPRD